MSLEKGDSIILGVGIEDDAARGTGVDAQIWIPGRSPAGVQTVVEKKIIEETKATKFDSYGSEITQKKVEGNLEFNVRHDSIGFLLLSLLGAVSSVAKASPNDAVYDHTFSIDADNVQNPSLTLDMSRAIQAYRSVCAVVGKLEINVSLDDLVKATAEFIAKSEAEHAAFSPSFGSTDRYFRQQDVTVKLASNLAGLDAASAIELKELTLIIDNKGRPDMGIGSLTPADVFGIEMAIGGKLSGNYTAKTNYDVFTGGTYKAMRIEFKRSDVTIGSNQNPTLKIDLPRISFEGYDQERPIEDVVKEGIDFKAHYSETDSKGIDVVLTNLLTGYVHA